MQYQMALPYTAVLIWNLFTKFGQLIIEVNVQLYDRKYCNVVMSWEEAKFKS